MDKQVALYVRVSTTRQALNDISIPDQIKQAKDYCRKKGWQITNTYIEPGASARSDKRPQFQKMIREACRNPSPYDIVLVHCLSRFFRDPIDQGLYKRKLEEHGVLLKSITQQFGDGPQADLIQTVIAACDAHNSAETAKHVSRSMIENARQGFWNGSRPPMGYRTYIAEHRGDKAKKKLEIEPKGAEIVKLIFKLFLEGHEHSGPMGIKLIAEYLNRRNYKTPTGGDYYTSIVHNILIHSAYKGIHHFNKHNSRTRKLRPREEWVPLQVPAIIDPEKFDLVQKRLKARSPQKVAPRLVLNSVLLSGIAHCTGCDSRLMLATGKNGRYRYYSCAGRHLKGKCSCNTPIRIPEAKLDGIVTEVIADKILQKDRLKHLLKQTLKRAKDNNQDAMNDLKLLRRELKEVDNKVAKLFEALTDGLVSDSKGFKDHNDKLETRRDELTRLITLKEGNLNLPMRHLSNAQLDRFTTTLKDMLHNGPKGFRKEYMKMLVSRVDVGKQNITVTGPKAALVMALKADNTLQKKVPSFVRDWCARQDSNLWPTD